MGLLDVSPVRERARCGLCAPGAGRAVAAAVRRPFVGVVLALGSLLGCHTLPSGDPHRPDVVLISIDSLRADHLSGYGYKRDTTPTLDALADKGLRFTHAISGSPWTLPSHMTMMTGLWPTQHQVIEDDRQLSASVPVVAERLQAAGYATAGFASAIYVSGGYGFARGFDTYQDFGLDEHASLGHQVRTPELVTSALGWAKGLPAGKPAFLFLHTYDAHYPYVPPEPWNTRYNRVMDAKELRYHRWEYFKQHPLSKARMRGLIAQYDECIRFVDDSLEPLIDTWSWDRDVVFIVIADHGEEFGERGSWGHAHTLYSEALDVPLIVSGTGVPEAVRSERVGNIDVAATVAAVAGVPWGIGDGVDVRGPVPDRDFWPETSRFDSNKLGLISGPSNSGSAAILDLAANTSERFDLKGDPRERKPMPLRNEAAAIARHLGEPWTLPAGVLTSTAALFSSGAQVERLVGPATFGMWPPDGTMTVDGAETGASAPVWSGAPPTVPHLLTADVKAELEALGYSEGADEPPAP